MSCWEAWMTGLDLHLRKAGRQHQRPAISQTGKIGAQVRRVTEYHAHQQAGQGRCQ